MPKPIPVFSGSVDDQGRLSLDRPSDWKRHQQGLVGQRIELTMRARKSKRSVDQNRLLWRCIEILAEHLGYDEHEHERLHYDLLSIRFGTVAQPPLLKGASPRIVPAQTSSPLNTAEFTDYLEWLVRYAAIEFGCVMDMPGDTVGQRREFVAA